MTRYNHTTVRDVFARLADSMSSFDESSTVSPKMIIDLKSVYPLSALRDNVSTASGGTVTQGNGEFSVSTSADPDSEASLTSVERARYIAGFDGIPGEAIRLTSLPTGNQEAEWGNTDFVNGFAVGVDADGMFTRLYSGGTVIEEQRREDWDHALEDQLDPLVTTIYRMPYRWYGAGPFRLQVSGTDDKGRGQMLHATATRHVPDDGPITEDPNQPLAVRVRNNGTSAALDVRVMGRQYFINGDYNPNRRIIGDYRIAQTVGTDFVPLIAFQQKNGVYESISTKIAGVDVLSTENLIWEVRVASELTGGTWTAPRMTDSGTETAMEVNLGATALTGGIQIVPPRLVAGASGNRASLSSADVPILDLPGGEPVVLCARAATTEATVTSTFRVREEWALIPFALALFGDKIGPLLSAMEFLA